MSERIYFGTIKEGIEPPNLIEVQLNSYVDFLQKDVPVLEAEECPACRPSSRKCFPIESYDEKATLDFSHYEIGEPKLTRARGAARRPDLQRAAPRHFPAPRGEGDEGRESLHGRNPAHDAAGHVRDQRRGARRRSASCIARRVSRSNRASISTARCSTVSGSFRIAVRGSKCSSTRAICFTFISIAANAAGNSSRRLSSARSATARTRK